MATPSATPKSRKAGAINEYPELILTNASGLPDLI